MIVLREGFQVHAHADDTGAWYAAHYVSEDRRTKGGDIGDDPYEALAFAAEDALKCHRRNVIARARAIHARNA